MSDRIQINSGLSEGHQQQLLDLVNHFSGCFSTESKVRRISVTKHRIPTVESARPVHQHTYSIAPTKRDVIKRQVQDMLNDDVIQPSITPWASPVVLVKKKDNTLRFCVDYRRLNSVAKRDVYLLLWMDDALDRLRHAQFFASLDLKFGYWQIEVDERDREKTAFVTSDELYEFKVLPFGLCSATATFQRMMDTLLSGLKWQTCLVYLDDVAVFPRTLDEHLERLRNVLLPISKVNLTIKPEKCHFGFQKLMFHGHVVTPRGVRPDPEQLAVIAEFPRRTGKKAVQRFFVLCAYYRRFVQGFSRIAEPITRLIHQDVPFEWTEEQQEAFTELPERLQRATVLAHFDDKADTDIHTDASNVGLGAILVQWQDGAGRVLAYVSRSLRKAEVNYSKAEKECLAVVWDIGKFRSYLYRRHFPVINDCHSLCLLASLGDSSGRLARWSLCLREYDVTVVYRSAQKHGDADCLSHAPIPWYW